MFCYDKIEDLFELFCEWFEEFGINWNLVFVFNMEGVNLNEWFVWLFLDRSFMYVSSVIYKLLLKLDFLRWKNFIFSDEKVEGFFIEKYGFLICFVNEVDVIY